MTSSLGLNYKEGIEVRQCRIVKISKYIRLVQNLLV